MYHFCSQLNLSLGFQELCQDSHGWNVVRCAKRRSVLSLELFWFCWWWFWSLNWKEMQKKDLLRCPFKIADEASKCCWTASSSCDYGPFRTLIAMALTISSDRYNLMNNISEKTAMCVDEQRRETTHMVAKCEIFESAVTDLGSEWPCSWNPISM